VEGNGNPGHKRSDDGPYTRTGQQTSRADRYNAVIEPAALPNRNFFNEPENHENSNAVPRSRADSRERSDRLKPGTSVSANAAVTNTQTLLKIISIEMVSQFYDTGLLFWAPAHGSKSIQSVISQG
jgi:hypothetical protein